MLIFFVILQDSRAGGFEAGGFDARRLGAGISARASSFTKLSVHPPETAARHRAAHTPSLPSARRTNHDQVEIPLCVWNSKPLASGDFGSLLPLSSSVTYTYVWHAVKFEFAASSSAFPDGPIEGSRARPADRARHTGCRESRFRIATFVAAAALPQTREFILDLARRRRWRDSKSSGRAE